MEQKQKAAFVSCSNGQEAAWKTDIEALIQILYNIGTEVVCSPCLYQKDGVRSGTARERAEALMSFYRDSEIRDIFDISGGDIANELLPWLDFEQIAASNARFWGYSDLTTIINAIYTKTGRSSVLYQIKNLLADKAYQDIFRSPELFQFPYMFLQGDSMEGVVVGGNIRCFLKLAGTPYFPDMDGKVLLLEALGGRVPQMITYLGQLQQLGAFEKVRGILLGTFTAMEQENDVPDIVQLVKEFAGGSLPIAKTEWIGHGTNARAICIGEFYRFSGEDFVLDLQGLKKL